MTIASIRRHVHGSDMEYLESRMLLSSVIAVSPGNQDATQMVQNALNNAGSGGTVNLAPGNYDISSQLNIPSGVALSGAGNASLNWTGGMGNLLEAPWTSVGTKVTGVTFNGAGYKIDPDGSNLTVSNNTFENISFADPYFGNGLYIPDVETGTSITGNTFTNITGNMGIYIFNAINTQITNNTFTNDSQAIKGEWTNGGANCSISNNSLSEIFRFGIECQGNPTNFTVSGNTLGNWQQRDGHIGLSIATGKGNGINITNNIILGTGFSNPNTDYTAIEAMGNNLTISGNFASGWGWAQLVGFTNHWVTENNTWGVNTAAWVIEAGGTNPSVDTGNTLVSLNAQPSAAVEDDLADAAPAAPAPTPPAPPTPVPAPSAPPAAAAVSTPPTPPAAASDPASAATPTTTDNTSASANPPAGTSTVAQTPDPAVPAIPPSSAPPTTSPPPATYSNDLYSVWGNGLDVSKKGKQSIFACQTASSGIISLIVRTGSAKPAGRQANVGVTIRSSLRPGSARLSLKAAGRALTTARSANGQTTRRLRVGAGFVYLRLARTGTAVHADYSTDGTDFTPIATIELNP